ncbi:unnamed protein product [Alopecurus aequalis]
MFGSSRHRQRHRHRSCRDPWTDLPPELLGLVLMRLPSHADRVRLQAVCRAWRSSARLQRPLPPLLPWLALPDGTFLSLPDGAVHRVPLPRDVSSRVSTGGALFLSHRDGWCSVTSLSQAYATTAAFWFRGNPIAKHLVRKAVVSDHLVAVLKSSGRNNVVVSTYSGHTRATTELVPPRGSFTVDIALFKDKLYVLTADLDKHERELHVLEDRDGRITLVCCIRSGPKDDHDDDDPNYDSEDGDMCEEEGGADDDDRYVRRDYLVVSGDQLLMVKRMMDSPVTTFQRDKRTHWFEVFEAVCLSGGRGRWKKVDTLRGRALFVSQGCSESLCAGGGIGVRDDCIYFMNENDR